MKQAKQHLKQQSKQPVADITPVDPADVMMIEWYFQHTPDRVDHIYRKRGRIFVLTLARGTDPMAPPTALIWCYDGVIERDVYTDGGLEAVQQVEMNEVGWVDGVTHRSHFWDEDDRHEVTDHNEGVAS